MPSTIVASGAWHIRAPAALHPYVSRRSRLPGEYAKPLPAANLQPVRQVRHELRTAHRVHARVRLITGWEARLRPRLRR